VFLDQSDLPSSIPTFQSLLALDCVFGVIELFEINEPADLIFLRKAFRQFLAMLGDAPNEVVGNANVKRAADAAGEDVELEAACSHLRSLEYWIVRLRGR
jgi:hypothetical protein